MPPSSAIAFSGKGTQYVGMGAWLLARSAAARRVVEEAQDLLLLPLHDLLHHGPEDALALTTTAQPALLTVGVAFWRALEEEGAVDTASVTVVAGHSLGEYAALVAAGALSFADALRVVRVRAQAMQDAVPVGQGAMAAILGIDLAPLTTLCADACAQTQQEVRVAVYNAPQSHVISGHTQAVEAVLGLVSEVRRAKAVRLPVSGPFHSPLLTPACAPLAAALAQVTLYPLRFPYIPNTTATPTTEGGDTLRDRLVAQVITPVRWQQTLQAMADAGAQRILHAGPGNMVAAQARQARIPIRVLTLDDPLTFDSLCSHPPPE
jgi:[acyl-carrier-protein] S-malonyltransferase